MNGNFLLFLSFPKSFTRERGIFFYKEIPNIICICSSGCFHVCMYVCLIEGSWNDAGLRQWNSVIDRMLFSFLEYFPCKPILYLLTFFPSIYFHLMYFCVVCVRVVTWSKNHSKGKGVLRDMFCSTANLK